MTLQSVSEEPHAGSWPDKNHLFLTAGMVLLIPLGLVTWLRRQPAPGPPPVVEPAPSTLVNLRVFVSSAVRNPGVYSLGPEGWVVGAIHSRWCGTI